MKHIKISVCILLCVLMLTSCGSSQNAEYVKSLIAEKTSEELMYMPKLLANYENTAKISVSAQQDVVTYYLSDTVESKNELVYQYINLHIQKHSGGENLDELIDETVDAFGSYETVKAVKHEYDGKKYAISYEIRPDLDIARITLVYALSDSVSAFYTLEIKDISAVDDKLLDDICEDTETIKL